MQGLKEIDRQSHAHGGVQVRGSGDARLCCAVFVAIALGQKCRTGAAADPGLGWPNEFHGHACYEHMVAFP